jgi:hypothetical protein
LNKTESYINQTLNKAESYINQTLNKAESYINQTLNKTESYINQTLNKAESYINQTLNKAESYINQTLRIPGTPLIETECHNVTEVLHKARLNNPNTFHHIIIMFFTPYLCVSTVHVKSQHDINILNFNFYQ